MSLQNLQTELIEAIFSDDMHTALTKQREHLSIYKNNILTNLLRALQFVYPMVKKLVGDEFFQLLSNEYIKQYPSRSPNLNDYGEYFKDFLTEHNACKELDYLTEIAYFEWICHRLSFAANPFPLDVEKIKNISSEDYNHLHFILHPACHLHQFAYPILRIIDLCQGKLNETINLDEGGVNLLIIRREFEIMLVELEEADFLFLNALNNNQSISQAMSLALNKDSQFSLQNKLSKWIKDNTLVDCYLQKNGNHVF